MRKAAHLYSSSAEQMLRHALNEHIEEEPGVLQELANDKLVRLCGAQSSLQVLRQLFVNRLLLRARYRLRHEHILQVKGSFDTNYYSLFRDGSALTILKRY